jgi:hypothetical protein
LTGKPQGRPFVASRSDSFSTADMKLYDNVFGYPINSWLVPSGTRSLLYYSARNRLPIHRQYRRTLP